jgi:hypothetical protein
VSVDESEDLLRPIKAAQCLQGCDHLRGHCVAAHSNRDNSPLSEITNVLVRLDHVARFIVNADHSIV